VNQIFPAEVRLSFVAIGVGTAVLTGVLAGLAPSAAAARLPPVEALRHD
jgi:ABC-type lipoprotein release transport system permease subunit